MKTALQFLIIVLISSWFVACNKNSHPVFTDSEVEDKQLDEQKFKSAIQFLIESQSDTSNKTIKQLKQWYSNETYSPVWIQTLENTRKIDTLLSFIAKITDHGLTPKQFNYDSIFSFTQELENGRFTYLQLAKIELNASIAYLKYCGGLKYGFVDQKTDSCTYYYRFRKVDSAFVDTCFITSNLNLNSFLIALQPNSKAYLALQWEHKRLRQFSESNFQKIPYLHEKESLKPGSVHPSIPLIVERLMITGQSGIEPNQTIFDQRLLKAINAFRRKNNLQQTNEIGNSTIKVLNMPISHYIDKINVNLERLRWKPVKKLGQKNIRVNVADMTLRAYNNDTLQLYMKVCVGKPPKNKTPFLQSKIQELIINPTWTVPNSIIIKEYTRICAKDTGYLRRHSIHVYKYGEEIEPKTIKWDKISKTNQPYKMVQESGDINSLGRLKFNFSNKFSVYLHDTNAKGAFRRNFRAVSHGCVRVEKPLDLALYCLPDLLSEDSIKIKRKDLLKDKIRYSMDLGIVGNVAKELLQTNPNRMKLKKVILSPSIPIIIEYQTCFLNLKGKVQFTNDIYKLDAEIVTQLKNFKL
jgi:L,D-transpeptidase YcbB